MPMPDQRPQELRFASLMSPIADPWCASLMDLVSETSAVPVRFVHEDDAARERVVRSGGVEFAWVCGLLHVLGNGPSSWPYRVVAAPTMSKKRYGSRPVYFGDVIVRSDSSPRTSLDVVDGVFAYNERSSFSGFHMAIGELGIGPDSRSVVSGSHTDSIRMVIDGEADWAVIDSTVLDMLQARGDTEFSQVRTIASIGPHPMPPFIARIDIDPDIVDDVVDSLTTIHMTPRGRELFGQYGVERIVPSQESAYRPIRDLNITID